MRMRDVPAEDGKKSKIIKEEESLSLTTKK